MNVVATNNILVIIKCLVYNHEPYLRQCLDGFVMQKTNFPFYAVVHDDCSTDNSAAIIREYAERYPDIIHPIYETENQYSKKDGSLGRIMHEASKYANYIAMCEGDDYWTDPLKLQKQVDFLEANLDYSICFTEVQVLLEKTHRLITSTEFGTPTVPETTTIYDLALCNYTHTLSVMFRYRDEAYLFARHIREVMGPLIAGDYVQLMYYAQYGKIKKISDCTGVYRVHGGGVWSTKDTLATWIHQLYCMTPFFDDDIKPILEKQFDMYLQGYDKQLKKIEREQRQLLSSKAYRLGKILLRPFSWLRNNLIK